MIVRQMTLQQYEHFRKSLKKTAHADPLDASCDVDMTINDVEYVIRVQLERHNKIAVLQALRMDRKKSYPAYELITRGDILSSLLEILIYHNDR